MGNDVLPPRAAWRAYRTWFEDERVQFANEPDSPDFEAVFESLSSGPRPSTKTWADAYLAAFAVAADFELVTFDTGFPRASRLSLSILRVR